MTSKGLESVAALKNDCQSDIVSDVWRVWDVKVHRFEDDVCGRTCERLVKGWRVGSSNSFFAQGVDENCAFTSLSGSSSKRRCGFGDFMIVAFFLADLKGSEVQGRIHGVGEGKALFELYRETRNL